MSAELERLEGACLLASGATALSMMLFAEETALFPDERAPDVDATWRDLLALLLLLCSGAAVGGAALIVALHAGCRRHTKKGGLLRLLNMLMLMRPLSIV